MHIFGPTLILLFLLCLTSKAQSRESFMMVYGKNYEPFSWQTKQGDVVGIVPDLIDEILTNRLGIKVDRMACAWEGCQSLVRLNKRDGFVTAPTAEREQYTVRTGTSLFSTNMIMFTWKGNPLLSEFKKMTSIDDLKRIPDLRFVAPQGSGWHREHFGEAKLTEISNSLKISRFLSNRRADLYIEQAEFFQYQINSLGLSKKIIAIPNSLKVVKLYLFLGLESPWRKALPLIDEELKKMATSGELNQNYQRLCEKYKVPILADHTTTNEDSKQSASTDKEEAQQ